MGGGWVVGGAGVIEVRSREEEEGERRRMGESCEEENDRSRRCTRGEQC
jgi:hypothetical protein